MAEMNHFYESRPRALNTAVECWLYFMHRRDVVCFTLFVIFAPENHEQGETNIAEHDDGRLASLSVSNMLSRLSYSFLLFVEIENGFQPWILNWRSACGAVGLC
jgi:hypothetical protein